MLMATPLCKTNETENATCCSDDSSGDSVAVKQALMPGILTAVCQHCGRAAQGTGTALWRIQPPPSPNLQFSGRGQVVSRGLWRLVPSIRMESSDATSLAANSAHTWGKARFASTGGTRHRSYLWPIYALLEWLVDTTLRLSKNVSAQTTTQHLLRLTGM